MYVLFLAERYQIVCTEIPFEVTKEIKGFVCINMNV